MGSYTGKYSRNPFAAFDEEKNYAVALLQEGVPVTDDDWNDHSLELFTRMRRSNQLFGDYGTPNDGFRIIQSTTSTINNFMVRGGGVGNSDIELAGRFFMKGISCLLLKHTDYLNTLSDLSEQSIHPRVTNCYLNGANTVIEDSAANWEVNELATRQITVSGSPYPIVSNTADEITISGDHVSAITVGDHYILTLSTPGAPRTDAVYLNVYLDEYGEADDADVGKTIGGTSIEAMRRAKVIQTIFVREAVTGPTELADYTDSDGNKHFVFKLATLTRDANNTITTAEITDLVPSIGAQFDTVTQSEISILKPYASKPVDDYLNITSGQFQKTDGTGNVSYGGGQIQIPAPGASARYDIVYIDDTGALGRLAGSEGGGVPDLPTEHLSLAVVHVTEVGGPVLVEEADITDIRPFLSADQNARRIQDRLVDSAAPNSGDGLLWDGSKWTPTVLGGWINLVQSGGSLSSQLSGMAAGDKYILDTSASWALGADLNLNQPGVRILAERGVVMDMANYTLTISAADVVIEGITFNSTVASTTKPMIDVQADQSRIRNATFQGTANRYSHVLLNSTGSKNCLIEGCKFDQALGGIDPSAFIWVASNATTGTGNRIIGCEFVFPSTENNLYGVYSDSVTAGPSTVVDKCIMTLTSTGASKLRVGVGVGNEWSVTKCRFKGPSSPTGWQYGIKDPTNLTGKLRVHACTFIDCILSVSFTGGFGGVFTKNDLLLTGPKQTPFLVTLGSGTVIEGNRIKATFTSGNGTASILTATGLIDAVIKGNYVYGDGTAMTAGSAIIRGILTNNFYTSIVGNTVHIIGHKSTSGPPASLLPACIYLESTLSVTITGNSLFIESIAGNYDISGIYVNTGCVNTVISGNTLHAIGGGGTGNQYGVYIELSTMRGSITGNQLYDGVTASYSVYIDNTAPLANHWVVTGNNFNGGISLPAAGDNIAANNTAS